jgi:Zn-dependent M16 (insulinase) family peptidase
MFNVGDKYLDFVVKKVVAIEELKATLIELEHGKTGALVMQIACDDPENLFCLSFETLPKNSNGVAHILEHTVLCGSKRFPIKDPFFAMTRRSLNTFMNALTGADFTCYPAASQVEKDFYNLLDVYLDAVFHPLLKKESFLQEGHRLEFDDVKHLKGLKWKGIVYNEMKGALASPDSRLWYTMMEALVPDLTYAHISGGDPKVIPQLSYEELIHFYETYYHPSRCLFFFYGNFSLKKHLDFLSEKVLLHCSKLPPLAPPQRQPRFSMPVEREGFYPATEMKEPSTLIAWGWLTVPIQDQETLLALMLLDAVLMETDASLLKLALLQSGLCTSAEAFLDLDMSEVPYLIVCKGCKSDNAAALQELILKTLLEVAEQGIAPHLIEAALHQLEFSRMEITGDHGPFGLTLFMRSALAKQHGCPPENALLIHTLFEKLRKKLEDPTYLTAILQREILRNGHRVRVVLEPDTELAQKETQEELENLSQLEADLPEAEKLKIAKETEVLKAYQKTVERQNLECLPKVELSDVPVLAKEFILKEKNHLFEHACFTNHLVYVDWTLDLPKLSEEELPYAQLLCTLLPELGVGKRGYIDNLRYLQSHVGGFSIGLGLFPQMENPSHLKPALLLRGKALERNAKELLTLFKDVKEKGRLDETDRIEELLLQMQTNLTHRLQKNALRYATQLALSGISLSAKIGEKLQGLSFLKWLQEQIKDVPRLIDRLKELQTKLFAAPRGDLTLTCDEKLLKQLEVEDYFGLLSLAKRPFTPWETTFAVDAVPSQARILATPVAFTCHAFPAPSYLHPHAPALQVATHLLNNKILHPKIREEGGAYSCGAQYSPMGGHFTFYAFRDPHLASTLKIFTESVRAIAAGEFEESDLVEAKLETVQQLDSPVSPGARGSTAYTWLREGKMTHHRQHFRDKILALTAQELRLAVKKELQGKEGIAVSFASKELLEKEPLPLIINPL